MSNTLRENGRPVGSAPGHVVDADVERLRGQVDRAALGAGGVEPPRHLVDRLREEDPELEVARAAAWAGGDRVRTLRVEAGSAVDGVERGSVGTSCGPAVQLVLATFASLAVAVGRRKRVSLRRRTVEKPDGSSTAMTVNSAVAGTFCGKRVSASRSSVLSKVARRASTVETSGVGAGALIQRVEDRRQPAGRVEQRRRPRRRDRPALVGAVAGLAGAVVDPQPLEERIRAIDDTRRVERLGGARGVGRRLQRARRRFRIGLLDTAARHRKHRYDCTHPRRSGRSDGHV